jgi:hypothetical protein
MRPAIDGNLALSDQDSADSISFWPLAALRGFLADFEAFADSPATRRRSGAAPPSVDDIAGGSAFLRRIGAGSLLVDEIHLGSFVLVLELLGFELSGLLVDDVPG